MKLDINQVNSGRARAVPQIIMNSIFLTAFIFPDWRVLYFLAGGDDAGLRGAGGVRNTME